MSRRFYPALRDLLSAICCFFCSVEARLQRWRAPYSLAGQWRSGRR